MKSIEKEVIGIKIENVTYPINDIAILSYENGNLFIYFKNYNKYHYRPISSDKANEYIEKFNKIKFKRIV